MLTATSTITVNNALVATLNTPTKGCTRDTACPFAPVIAAGGTAPLTYTISPALPVGLILNTGTGAISGNPAITTASASYRVTVRDATASSAFGDFSLVVNAPVTTAVTTSTASCTAGATCSFTPVTLTGGTAPFTYSVTPNLPAGMTINPLTGLINGTPTAAQVASVVQRDAPSANQSALRTSSQAAVGPGSALRPIAHAGTSYTVTVTDAVGATGSASFVLTVNPALTTTLANASYQCTVNSLCAFTAVTATGGTAPLTFGVSPSLPTGLTLDASNGAINGIASASAAPTTLRITVTDAASVSSFKEFQFAVNGPLTATLTVPNVITTVGISFATAFSGGVRPVTGAGGTGTLSYEVSPALPTGVTLNSQTGRLEGTPSNSGTSSYTVTVRDQAGASAARQFALSVNTPVSASALLATKACTQNASCAFTPVAATGGTGALTFSIVPALPSGMSFSNGALGGTPTVTLSATTFTVTATDAVGASGSATFSLTVNSSLNTTLVTASGQCTVGTICAYTPVTASGGTAPVAFTISPVLSAGLSFNATTGAIGGTPSTSAALTTYRITATDAAGASSFKDFLLTVNGPVSATLAVPTVTSTVNVAFSTAFPGGMRPVVGGGGTGALTYEIAPALPSGLSINGATGAITGSPVAAGSSSYTVTVRDQTGANASKTFALSINGPVVATQLVATKVCTQGAACAVTPVSASGGTTPMSYSIAPVLPAGLFINSATGAVTGTASVASTASIYTVTATDAVGATATATFSLTVNNALSTTLNSATYQCTAGAACAFSAVTALGGTVPYTYAVSPSFPTGLSFSPSTGAVSGTAASASALATYRITVSDNAGASSFKDVQFAVNAALSTTLATPTITSTANVSFATAFPSGARPVIGAGGTGTLSYEVAPALPNGLTISPSSGQISGIPTASSSTTYTITVRDQAAASSAKNFTLNINPALAATQAVATKQCVQNVSCPFTPVTVSGGTAPVLFSVTPALQSGLSFNGATGAITGSPASVQNSATYTVTLTDAVGATATNTFSLSVLPALSTTLAIAQVACGDNGCSPSAPLTPVTAAGGAAPYTFSVSPALPNGLQLNSATGAISGAPTVASNPTSYTITVSDAQSATSSKAFTLSVIKATSLVSTQNCYANRSCAFTPAASSGGVAPVTWSVAPALATGLSISPSTGQITGTATVAKPSTVYTVTATDALGRTAQLSLTFVVSAECTWCETMLTFDNNATPTGWQQAQFGPNAGTIANGRVEATATDRGLAFRSSGPPPSGTKVIEMSTEGPMADVVSGMFNVGRVETGTSAWGLDVATYTCIGGCGPPPGAPDQLVLRSMRFDAYVFPQAAGSTTNYTTVTASYPSGTIVKITRQFYDDGAAIIVQKLSDLSLITSQHMSLPGFRVADVTGVGFHLYFTSGSALTTAWIDNVAFRFLSQPSAITVNANGRK
jgi:hypothetical protein